MDTQITTNAAVVVRWKSYTALRSSKRPEVDVLSIVLAAIGWQKDRNNKISDRRIEAYRLNAEVAAEAAQCANTLSYATTDILRRVNLLFPDQPEAYQSVSDKLTTMLSQARQIQTMAERNKQTIEKAGTFTDWDNVLLKMHEWRATVSMMRPQTDDAIKIYKDLLENAEMHTPPSALAPQQKERGWDAPPL